MPKPEVDVIVGSRDGKEHLARCLEFVYAQEYDGPIHTHVVDNDSRDASSFLVNSRYPQVRLTSNKDNVGRAGAYNQALAKARGRYVIFLSQDVEIAKNFIASHVEFIAQTKGVAGLSSRVLLRGDAAEARAIDSIGLALKGPIPIRIDHEKPVTTALDRPREVFGPAGAAAFWDRACLDELARGGMIFDEDMIDGLLDFDVAWRARWLGHRFWYNPGAFVLHNRGVLYTNHEERRREHEFLQLRSHLLCYRKNLLFDGWRRFGRKVNAAVRKDWFDFLKKYGLTHGVDVWLSARTAYPAMRRKRKQMETVAKCSAHEIYRNVFSMRALKE